MRSCLTSTASGNEDEQGDQNAGKMNSHMPVIDGNSRAGRHVVINRECDQSDIEDTVHPGAKRPRGRFAFEVEVMEPPRRLAWRWSHESDREVDAGPTTRAEFRLEARPDGGSDYFRG